MTEIFSCAITGKQYKDTEVLRFKRGEEEDAPEIPVSGEAILQLAGSEQMLPILLDRIASSEKLTNTIVELHKAKVNETRGRAVGQKEGVTAVTDIMSDMLQDNPELSGRELMQLVAQKLTPPPEEAPATQPASPPVESEEVH